MALKRPNAPVAAAQPQAASVSTPPVTAAPPVAPVTAAPPVAPVSAPLAVAQPQATAVSTQTNGAGRIAMMDFHNQGGEVVLEGFDEWNGGNYVTVDGSDFYIKKTETRVRDLTVIISFARQFYSWYDRDTKQWHESPTKLNKDYSLKAEINWYDWIDGEEEPQKFIYTASTTSAMAFRDYIAKLRDSGVRINAIWTRMTIERLERLDPDTKEKQRYSRVKFENSGPVEYDQAAQ